MAKSRKQRRRRWRRAARAVLFATLICGALPGVLAALVSGHASFLWLVPAGIAAAPIVLLALAMAVISMALPLIVVTLVFGGPLYLVYRLLDAPRRAREAEEDALGPEGLLRRRYVAGDLTYAEFQDGMMTLLKERYARGEMALSQFEAEVERLLEPLRRLDVKRDPRLSGLLRGR
jgi:uncharacterized membrane protein